MKTLVSKMVWYRDLSNEVLQDILLNRAYVNFTKTDLHALKIVILGRYMELKNISPIRVTRARVVCLTQRAIPWSLASPCYI